MSYTKTTWASGDTITAEKLNNIESGVEAASAGGGAYITTSFGHSNVFPNQHRVDATYGEIKAMLEAGIFRLLDG